MSTSVISGPREGDLATFATSLSFGIDRILSKTLGDVSTIQRFTTVNDPHKGGETTKDDRLPDDAFRAETPVKKDARPNFVLESRDSSRPRSRGSGEKIFPGLPTAENDLSESDNCNKKFVSDSCSQSTQRRRQYTDEFSEITTPSAPPKTLRFCSYLKSEDFSNTAHYTLPNYTYIRCVGDQDVENRLSSYGVDWLRPCVSSCANSCCSRRAGGTTSKPPFPTTGPQACPQHVTPVRKLRHLGVHFPTSCISPWTRQPPSWIDVRRERVSLVLRGPMFEKSQPKRKKPRTSFTRLQIVELEKRFHRQKYLSSAERSSMAKTLKMTDGQVKTWFQNRRTKWRRQTAEERDAEREAASRLILSLQTDKSQCLDVTDSVCLRNSSLHALQNLRPWKDEGAAGESDT